jgi:hypothetical protein
MNCSETVCRECRGTRPPCQQKCRFPGIAWPSEPGWETTGLRASAAGSRSAPRSRLRWRGRERSQDGLQRHHPHFRKRVVGLSYDLSCSPDPIVDELRVARPVRDQLPAAHPAIRAPEFLFEVWPRGSVPQSRQVKVLRL